MPSAPRDGLRVGLLGPYGGANLGDTSIQISVMAMLRARLPGVRFLGIATDPADVVRTHGLKAHATSGAGGWLEPLANPADASSAQAAEPRAARGVTSMLPSPLVRLINLWGMYRAVGALDVLIFSGSGQIDDYWGGPWEHPYRLLAWSLCARLRGVRVAVLGIGVDELKTKLGAWFALKAMALSGFRAFRDSGSLELLRGMGMTAPSRVCPDPAFGLSNGYAGASQASEAAPAYVLISPLARATWSGPEDEAYETYLRALAFAAERLLERGLEVRFACTQTRMDPPVVDRVKAHMTPEAAARCALEPIARVEDYLRVAGPAALIIASRFHAVILGVVAGAPVIDIAYSRKSHQLMLDLGMPECCLALREARAETLWPIAEKALARRAELRAHIAEKNRELRAELDGTCDQLIATVTPKLP